MIAINEIQWLLKTRIMLLNTRTCNLMDDIVLSCLDAFILDGTAPINMVPQNIRECNGDWLTHVKVKVTLVQALRICTDPTAHRGSRGIALPFHDHGTKRGEGSPSRPRPSLPRERPSTHCTGGWVGPRAGLDRRGKSHPHRDSILGPSSP